MHVLRNLVFFALSLFSTLGHSFGSKRGSGGGGGSSSNISKSWPKFSCTKKVSSQIVVGANDTFDGKNCEYIWTGKYANKCDAPEEYSENVPKMFRLERGATLKNVAVRCSPDGIQMGDKTRLDNVWIHVEEDGVNISGSNDVRLNKVRFYQFSDKALQINPGTGSVTCNACEFYDGKNAIKYDGNSLLTVTNSKFQNVKQAVRVTKSPGRGSVSKSTFQDVTCALVEQGGGRVADDGGNSFGGAQSTRCN
jgi:hypothetical protein